MKRAPGPRLLTAGLLLTLGLTACGGPVEAGSAAIVGDERLGGSEFTDQIRDALATPGVGSDVTGDVPAFQRGVLSQFITLQLLEHAAEQNGISVGRGAIDAQMTKLEEGLGGAEALMEQAAKAGFSAEQVRGIARANAILVALRDRLPGAEVSESDLRQAYDAQKASFEKVRVAEIQLASVAEAEALLPEAEAGTDASFAALAKERSLDTDLGPTGGDTGLQPASAFEQAGQPTVAAQAFVSEVGDVFVTPAPAGALLVRVLQRETTTFEDARPQLEQALAGPQQQQVVEDALRQAEADLRIKVNPRYGQWDAETLSVVAGGDRELSRPAGEDREQAADPAEQLLQPPPS